MFEKFIRHSHLLVQYLKRKSLLWYAYLKMRYINLPRQQQKLVSFSTVVFVLIIIIALIPPTIVNNPVGF